MRDWSSQSHGSKVKASNIPASSLGRSLSIAHFTSLARPVWLCVPTSLCSVEEAV